MALELFWASGSGFSWRVLLALEVKRVPYESRLVSFSAGDLRTPEFAAINPRLRVPALRDGAYTLYESVACLAYIDRKHPDPPLFGRTAEETGLVWRAICEQMAYLDDPVERFILPLYAGKQAEEAEQIRAQIPILHAELQRLETALADAPFLARSPTVTAADCTVYPMVRSILRAAEKPGASAFTLPFMPLAQVFPNVGAWMKRIEVLPGFERTFPPHWR